MGSPDGQASTAEHARLAEATGAAEDDPFEANPWYEWGPYLSERACGSSPTGWSASGSRDPTVADPSTAASTSCSPDQAWKDHLLFYEHFHGHNGAGLGVMHQTGWTALVADLILDPPRHSRRMIFRNGHDGSTSSGMEERHDGTA